MSEASPRILVQGLDMLTDCDYVAIFDADFKPDPDFLVSTSGSSVLCHARQLLGLA